MPGVPGGRVRWVMSPTNKPGVVPSYSTSIDAAAEFAQALVSPDACGVTFDEQGRGKATIEYGGETYSAVGATPALALCIAALKAKHSRDGDS